MWILRTILAILSTPLSYVVFYNSLHAFLPSAISAVLAVGAAIMLALLIAGARLNK